MKTAPPRLTRHARIDYSTLLGRTDLACAEVVERFFRLAGVVLPPGALASPGADCWQPLGPSWRDAVLPLDVPEQRGCASHVGVLTAAGGRGRILSYTVAGGVCAVPAWTLTRVLGAYRLKGLWA
jgi:hypothetical protein